MRGLPIHHTSRNHGYTQQQSDPLCFPLTQSTLFARIRQIFKGPPHRQPKPDLENNPRAFPSEKRHHHVPTHAASSFVRTTTTNRMRMQADERELHVILKADGCTLPPRRRNEDA